MEKYGVLTSLELEKTAERMQPGHCPVCGAELKDSNPPICPNCGSAPFEKAPKKEGQ